MTNFGRSNRWKKPQKKTKIVIHMSNNRKSSHIKKIRRPMIRVWKF